MDRTLTIRVPDELYDKVKIEVIKKKTTLKDYIINLIEKDLSEERK